MEKPHPHIEVTGAFQTRALLPSIPELEPIAYFDQEHGKYDETGEVAAELRVKLHEIDLTRLFGLLREHSVSVVRHWLQVDYKNRFWMKPPEDCIGAVLRPDGYVGLPPDAPRLRILSMSEPFYIQGRPEGEPRGHRPDLMSAGGIPIVSDCLLSTLRGLGVGGQTQEIIYRGANKAASNTIQPGFQRLLIDPQFSLTGDARVRFLPEPTPDGLGICCVLNPNSSREQYEIAVPTSKRSAVLTPHMNLGIEPIFRSTGLMNEWFERLNLGVKQCRTNNGQNKSR